MTDYFRKPEFAVKAISEDVDKIEGVLVPFGSKVRRDLYGEYFTPETDIKEDWYKERPLLYGHGRSYSDGSPGANAIGVIKSLTKQELGWWAKAELDQGSMYFDYIRDLIRGGDMFFSSGAIPGMVDVDRDGEIKVWPVIEGSLTPTPAEPRRTNVAFAKSFFTALDIPFIDFEKKNSKGENKMAIEKDNQGVKDEQPEVKDVDNSKTHDTIEKTVKVNLDLDVNLKQGEQVNGFEANQAEPKQEKQKELEKAIIEEPVIVNAQDNTNNAPAKDSAKPEKGNERMNNMDVQLQKFIIGGAKNLGYTVNEQGAELVGEQIKSYAEGITGSKDITMPQLKLLTNDPNFMEKAAQWFKEHSENGELDDLMNKFARKEAQGEEKQSNEKAVGAGGNSKAGNADAVAGKNINFHKNFKLRHKYSNLSPSEKSFYAHKMNDLYLAKYNRPWEPPDGFYESLEEGSEDFVNKYHSYMATGENEVGRTSGDMPIAAKHLETIREVKNRGGSHDGIKSALRGIKTNELGHSTQVGYGDEWVPDLWQSELWGLMKSEAVFAGMIPITAMPSNPYNIPLEGEDPDIYTTPETQHDSQLTNTGPLPASKIPTANTLIYAHKLGIRTPLSHEYEEDAIIDVIPNMLNKQRRAMYNGIDNVLLNAHYETSASNLGHYGTAPHSQFRGLLGIGSGTSDQGVWVQTLLDNSGDNVLDAGHGLPRLEMWRKAQGMLHEEYMAQESDLVWIVTPRVRHTIKSTDKFLDAEIHSGSINGQFGSIEGISVVTAHQLGDGDEQGRRVASAQGQFDQSDNNRGRALLLYKPYWRIGYRRRLQTWSLYDPVYDAYQAGAWIRLGLLRRDNVRVSSIGIRNLRI